MKGICDKKSNVIYEFMNKSIVNISVAYVSMNSYRKLDLFRKKIKSVQFKGGVDGGTCSSLIIVC